MTTYNTMNFHRIERVSISSPREINGHIAKILDVVIFDNEGNETTITCFGIGGEAPSIFVEELMPEEIEVTA